MMPLSFFISKTSYSAVTTVAIFTFFTFGVNFTLLQIWQLPVIKTLTHVLSFKPPCELCPGLQWLVKPFLRFTVFDFIFQGLIFKACRLQPFHVYNFFYKPYNAAL